MQSRLSQLIVAAAFLGPFLVLFLVFMVYPLLSTLSLAFYSGGLISGLQYVGFENFMQMFDNRLFVKSIVFTATYIVIIIPAVLAIALTLAVLLTQDWVMGRNAFKSIIFMPHLLPMVTLAVLWTFMIHPEVGLINLLMSAIGLEPPSWRGNATAATASIILIELWRGTGFYLITFIAGIVAIPREHYEAARMDGATPFQLFWFVTLPMLRSTILFCVVIATIFNLQVFDSVFVVTGGGPGGSTQSVAWYIFSNAFRFDQIGRASAMATMLFFVIAILTFIQFRLFRER